MVEKGEHLSIMGPSGSGKSTLMHLLGALDKPTSGELLLDGVPVASLSDEALAALRNRKIGFVFQSFHLLPQLTALENVELPLTYTKLPPKERKARAERLLKEMGLRDHLQHKPGELSGGERQRIAIARALVTEPEIILADEPTGNLDSKAGKVILDILTALNEKGVTLIVVTHNPSIALFAKRLLKVHDGKIVGEEFPSPRSSFSNGPPHARNCEV